MFKDSTVFQEEAASYRHVSSLLISNSLDGIEICAKFGNFY